MIVQGHNQAIESERRNYKLWKVSLTRSLRSQGLLSSDHGFDTIIHILNELDLVSSESSQVGNIENTIISLGVLTMDTSNLDVVLIGDRLVEGLVLHQFWQVDVDRGSQTGSHVGWASGDVTEVLIVGELSLGLDNVGGISESLENGSDIGTLLHGDDSKLILLIDPDEEGLLGVVEDTSSFWPFSLETSGFKIFVTTLEKEVIGNQLLFLSLGHSLKRVVFTLKFSSELIESRHDKSLDLLSLFSCNGGSKRIGSEVSGNSNSSGVDHLVLVGWERWAVKLVVVHGRNVLVSWLMTVVRLDDLVHEWSEGIVRVVRTSINTDARVSPLGTREDGLSESETEFISSVFALFPDILGKAFLEERSATGWEVWHTSNVLWVF